MEVTSYHEFIISAGQKNVDDRSASLEVQFDVDIEINSTNVIAIILPEKFLELPYVVDLIKAMNIEVDIYNDSFGAANEHMGAMKERVTEFLIKKGYLVRNSAITKFVKSAP